jgi:hypothetical protein
MFGYPLFLVFGTNKGKTRPTTPQITVKNMIGMKEAAIVMKYQDLIEKCF